MLEILGGFLFVPHLVENYAEIVDERGRNLMCDWVLPILLVHFYAQFQLSLAFLKSFLIYSQSCIIV